MKQPLFFLSVYQAYQAYQVYEVYKIYRVYQAYQIQQKTKTKNQIKLLIKRMIYAFKAFFFIKFSKLNIMQWTNGDKL